MTKERKDKKILKSVYKNIRQLQIENNQSYCNNFFEFTNNLYPWAKKLEDINQNPSPLLAFCIGIDTRESNYLKQIGIENNKQILDIVLVNEFLNYILKNTNLDEEEYKYQNLDECLNYFLNQKNPLKKEKRKGSFLKKIFKKNEKDTNEETLGKALEEKFELNKEKLCDYINNFTNNLYTSFIEILKKMNGKLNELNLLENYKESKEKIDNLKKIGIEKKIYIKEKNEEKLLSDKEIKDIAINYALKEIDFIKDNISLVNNYEFYKFFFQDAVQDHYSFLKEFLLSNIENDNEIEMINKLDEIVEKKKEIFSENLSELQDELLESAQEKAQSGNLKYKEDLFNFINLSINYSQILEEDKEEIKILYNIYNPDLHVKMNEKNKEETLPLYKFYKNLSETSLIKNILNIELSYIKAKNHAKNL
ncbi:MAG: hypothetical protein QXK80_01195 [Candidatus Pacearchaeota archaeon]